MRLLYLALTIFPALMMSCKQVTVKHKMLPALYKSDSAVVMYYHVPGEPRFFNMFKLKDSAEFAVIIADVNGPVIDPKDSCTTQGKIYLYGKNGSVETIYFSRWKDCMTLSFMKGAEKYYTSMSRETLRQLDNWEKNVTVLPGRPQD